MIFAFKVRDCPFNVSTLQTTFTFIRLQLQLEANELFNYGLRTLFPKVLTQSTIASLLIVCLSRFLNRRFPTQHSIQRNLFFFRSLRVKRHYIISINLCSSIVILYVGFLISLFATQQDNSNAMSSSCIAGKLNHIQALGEEKNLGKATLEFQHQEALTLLNCNGCQK